MIRRYGRSPRGERLVGAVPYGHWKTTTFVAGPRCDGLTAPFVNDGPINGEWFRTCVEKVLAPTQRPGDIVILGNLGAHKVAGVRAAVDARGPGLLYLPPYSPDLNPIEQLFAKLKALLRKAAARTVEALWTAVATLLTAFGNDECANYFANASYRRSSGKRSGVPFPLHSSAAAPLALWRDREEAYRVPAAPLTSSLQDPRVLAFLLVWFGVNLLLGLGSISMAGVEQAIAWQAHIGGFLAGLLAFAAFDPIRSRRAAARMKAWTRRPQRSILIRSPVALCSQCHGAQGAAPRALRTGARGDTCAWRPSSCADCVNLSVLFHAAVRSEAPSAAGRLRVAATAFRAIAVCAM
jgi:transposase/cytochrome c553